VGLRCPFRDIDSQIRTPCKMLQVWLRKTDAISNRNSVEPSRASPMGRLLQLGVARHPKPAETRGAFDGVVYTDGKMDPPHWCGTLD
jgi:hypothetical protein